MKRAEAVVAGHICLDIIPELGRGGSRAVYEPGKLFRVGPAVISTGGAVSNTGLALHRLGHSVRLAGKIGDDPFGETVRAVLRRYGPHLADALTIARGERTSYSVVLNPPDMDRCFLHHPGANDAFDARDVSAAALTGVRLFHFGYPPIMQRMYERGGAELVKILRRAKSAGATTSLDLAQPDPRSPAGRADWRRILARALPRVDVFLPSLDEILFMLDRPFYNRMTTGRARVTAATVSAMAEKLIGMGCAVVGIKLGADGFYLRTTDDAKRLARMGGCTPSRLSAWTGRELLALCFRVRVAGTTGSGDCTIAGFLAALLRGYSPEDAATRAVAVGACNVEAADALSGVRSWAATEQRIAAGWKRLPVRMSLTGWRYDNSCALWKGPDDSSGKRGRS